MKKSLLSWGLMFIVAGVAAAAPVTINSGSFGIAANEALCQSDECEYRPGWICWPPNEETYLENWCLKAGGC